MEYKVVLTDTAKQDLREIAFYIAEESKDKGIAKRFVNELREETRRLGTLPNAGALPRDRILKSLGYRYLVHKEYLTFYLVDEQQKKVFVMAIFNGKRDYMRVMRKLI
jgi:toxin ParE1/3/4